MLWTWSNLYHRQLDKGQDYRSLTPTISIWFVDDDLFPESTSFHHRFGVLERDHHELFCDHLDLQIIEMGKWNSCLKTGDDIDLWLEFLNCSSQLDPQNLPPQFQSSEFQKAVSTIEHFSESDVAHDLYMRRLEYLSVESSWKGAVQEAEDNAAREAENAAREAERADLAEFRLSQQLDQALKGLVAKGMSESDARSVLGMK
jgi:predicted transposase/invertase (TIGR01784 family)